MPPLISIMRLKPTMCVRSSAVLPQYHDVRIDCATASMAESSVHLRGSLMCSLIIRMALVRCMSSMTLGTRPVSLRKLAVEQRMTCSTNGSWIEYGIQCFMKRLLGRGLPSRDALKRLMSWRSVAVSGVAHVWAQGSLTCTDELLVHLCRCHRQVADLVFKSRQRVAWLARALHGAYQVRAVNLPLILDDAVGNLEARLEDELHELDEVLAVERPRLVTKSQLNERICIPLTSSIHQH